jgi:hypothetical protein
VWLSRAFQDLSNGDGGVVIGVREWQIQGWQCVPLEMNQLFGSTVTGFWDGGSIGDS